MPFKVRVEFGSLKEAVKRLDAIPRALKKKALRAAVNEASRLLLWAARARVPRRLKANLPHNWTYKGGQLKRALGRKVKVYGSGVAVGIVGARQGFRIEVGKRVRKGKRSGVGDPIFVNPVKYLHLVELGTRHSPGAHFLRDAMRDNAGTIQAAMTKIIDDAIRAASAGGGS